MARLPLDFVRCVECGHVFNTAFDYANVPYSEKPNLMYNRGQIWSEYIAGVQCRIAEMLPREARIVEIGYGDGSFLCRLAELRPDCHFTGFDPNGASAAGAGNPRFRRELFDPAIHLGELVPDLIISRHVLEHLTDPLSFLQAINFAATSLHLLLRMYFEVPCIDRALETLRTVDFYYEHNSQFTSTSFRRMLERSGAVIEHIGTGYSGEVVHAFIRAAAPASQLQTAAAASAFAAAADAARTTISLQLMSLQISGKSVAVWGGTGKSAAFINRYGLDRERFPVVVDSDPTKAGTFVPGTGQEIRYRDWLLEHPAEVIVIPPQWRAADIVREMDAAGITYESVLIECHGMLIDYFEPGHPYSADATGVAENRRCPHAARALAVIQRVPVAIAEVRHQQDLEPLDDAHGSASVVK
jgi:hypothetical protein